MRKLCAFAVPFCAAVFSAVLLLPEGALLPAAALCALPALSAPLWRGDARLRVVLIALGAAAGLLWTGLFGAWRIAPALALDGQTRPVEAEVADYPTVTDDRMAVAVRIEGIRATLFTDASCAGVKPGDVIFCTASLRRSDVSRGEAYLGYWAKGIYLNAYARGEARCAPCGGIPPRYLPRVWAAALKDSLRRCFGPELAPFFISLVTGDKSLLPGDVYTALRRTGLAHVVAVSGLHVTFLAGFAGALFGRRRRGSAALGLLLCVCFAALAGFTPSVVRAVFFQAAILLAPLLGREEDRPTTLSAALLVLLVQNPYAAAGIALQLSFAAVAGISLLTGRLNRRWTARLPTRPGTPPLRLGCALARFALGTLATTLGALLFTTPLMAFYFRSVSLIAPLANLLCLWAVSYAFLGGLIAALAGLALPALGAAAAAVAAVPGRCVLWTAARLSRFPFAAVSLDAVYLLLWLLLAYAVALLYLLRFFRRGAGGRPLIPLCGCGAALALALVLNAASLSGECLRMSVLDVGQGLCVALRAGGRTVLVDCGGNTFGGPGDLAADYLQGTGAERLDVLILTHCHADHAGGVPELLARLDVGLIVLPQSEEDEPLRREILDLAAERGVPVQLLDENAVVELGPARLTLYAPLGDGGINEEGLSVLCTSGDFDVLITGDMNQAVEKRLIKYGALPDVEVLVAGHHGSKYATSPELLRAVTPEYAVVSSGYNAYGHPAPETLSRLAEAGCAVYRTDLMGDITITYRG